MGRLALSYGGAAVGAFAGSFLGMPQLGAALGYAAGTVAGGLLFHKHAPGQDGPRLNDRSIQVSSWGLEIPELYGRYRLAGNLIWATPLVETASVQSGQSGGGKGGTMKGEAQTSTTYTYSGNFAVAFCRGPIQKFNKIWADGKLIYGPTTAGRYDQYFTFHLGTETQLPDPTIQTDKGVLATPAHRGLAYFVCTALPLADFGNRIPQFTAEVIQANLTDGTYNSEFGWHVSAASSGQYLQRADTLDSFGSIHVSDGTKIVGVKSDGTVLYTLTGTNIADALNTWIAAHASAFSTALHVPVDAFGPSQLAVNPVSNGARLVISCMTNPNTVATLRKWVTVWNPSASGVPTLAGAVWYYSLTDVPYTGTLLVYQGGLRGDSDTLFGFGSYGIGAFRSTFIPLPSVSEIVSGAFNTGFTTTTSHAVTSIPGQIPLDHIHLGTSGTSAGMETSLYPWAVDGGAMNYTNLNGWMLPALDISSGLPVYVSYFYMLFGRPAAEYIAAHHGSTDQYGTEFYSEVIAPNPHGCLIRWNFGSNTFRQWIETIGGFTIGTPAGTGVRDWYLGAPNEVSASMKGPTGVSVVPFDDEGFSWVTGASSSYGDTTNRYQTRPTIMPLPSGGYLVGFVGTANEAVSPAYYAWMRVRAFAYDPASATFVQQTIIKGIGYADSDQGSHPSLGGAYDDNQKILQLSGTSLYVWGVIGPAIVGGGGADAGHHVYRTRLGFLDATGSTRLDVIVKDICRRCGLTDGQLDVSALSTQAVKGFLIGANATGRASIEVLQSAFYFDGVESAGALVFRFRDGTSVDSVPFDDLGAAAEAPPDDQVRLTETRGQEIDLPRWVIVSYPDWSVDYQMASQHERRGTAAFLAGDPQKLDLPIVLSADEAKAIAQKTLYMAWMHRTAASFVLPPKYVLYDPTDTITVTWDGGAQATLYLTKSEFGGDGTVRCEAVTTDATVYVAAPASGSTITGAQGQGSIPAVDEAVTLEMIDGPLLRDADDTWGYYAAAKPSATGWHGGGLYASADGTTYAKAADLLLAGPAGSASTVLAAPAAFEIIDTASTVAVSLPSGFSLASVTDAQLLAGANAAMVGDELVYFGTVVQTSAHHWTLSRFLRGRQGTDWAMAGHAAPERFVVLASDGTIVPVTTSAGENGLLRHYKAVSLGGVVADAPDATATIRSNRLKPLAPIHVAGSRDGSNNLTLTWIRRSRLAAVWVDGIESAPLDEPVEAYQIDVMSGVTVLRTLTASAPTVTYSASDQTVDGITPGDPVTVNVYQMSSRVGRGYARGATV